MTNQDPIAKLTTATQAHHDATQQLTTATTARNNAIHAALNAGVPITHIAQATGLSRVTIYAIRDKALKD